MKKYTKEDLPTGQEVFVQLKTLKNADKAKIDNLRDYLFEKAEILKSVISAYLDNTEWIEDPEVYTKSLLNYHHINGGLLALSDGVYERAVSMNYRELTEQGGYTMPDGTLKKLAQGDRDSYAKGDASDLRGLKRDLEETQRNLWERIQLARYKK